MSGRNFLIILISILCIWADEGKYWLFLKDKGDFEKDDIVIHASKCLSENAISRRFSLGIGLDRFDLPVFPEYVSRIASTGARVVHVSRWHNAISVRCADELIPTLSALPFVERIQKVKTFRIKVQKPMPVLYRATMDDIYGLSVMQAEMVGATWMHKNGYYGEGIVIGMLDSGYDIYQPAFDSLRANGQIIAKYDFVHNDTSVGYEQGDWDRRGFNHGTSTLSCIGANVQGLMFGIAPKASFALAKTEITDTLGADYERQIEEDNWQAGIEWLDSVGVDIVTSSLGYFYFDSDHFGYSFDQLNGDIALTTRAADIAASKGIAVFNSAGNERDAEGGGHIIAPADGDSVCAVGAVEFSGIYAYFSSPGPAADGRIKPDLSARGASVIVWNPISRNIALASGTSYACPITAGTAALVLEALRRSGAEIFGWTLIERLKMTADQAESPDNDYGWGIPKAPVAANLADAIFGKITAIPSGMPLANVPVIVDDETLFSDARGRFCAFIGLENSQHSVYINRVGFYPIDTIINHRTSQIHRVHFELLPVMEDIVCFPNPFSNRLNIAWEIKPDKLIEANISIFNAAGEIVRQLSSNEGYVTWDCKNASGQEIADGIYIICATISEEDGYPQKVHRMKVLKAERQ